MPTFGTEPVGVFLKKRYWHFLLPYVSYVLGPIVVIDLNVRELVV
jgi:hypothetical protein